MKKRIVLCLGGNALGDTVIEQKNAVQKCATIIARLVKEGHELVISHGNGPQVGMINLAFEKEQMPFPECGAMSQGYIGYHLQQAIYNALSLENISKVCATVITQTLVDENDSAFSNPTKPIGKFYEKNFADEIALQKGYTFVKDAGRGYRRVVASPSPIAIVESKIIEQILKSGNIVIAVGGGGVPVIKSNNVLKGVDAVIDKDLANAKLALELNADLLLILTAVEKVAINFNKPNEQFLSHLTVDECKKYIADGHFAKGSMLPKVEACVQFVSESNNFSRDTSYSKKAVITSLSKAEDALHGKTGTLITSS